MDAQRELMNASPFYSYAKPVKKPEFNLETAVQRLLTKAANEGATGEEIATMLERYKAGLAPVQILVPKGSTTVPHANTAQQNVTDEAAAA